MIMAEFNIVSIDKTPSLPNGDDYRKVIIEIDGRKMAFWTTESNLKAIEFDKQQKSNERR